MNKKCMLEVWNSQKSISEFVEGIVINEVNGHCNEEFNRYDVKTNLGTFYGCHPNCIKYI